MSAQPKADAAQIASYLSKAKRSPTGWKACCPAHDDKNPSLFIADGTDGVAMVCYAGCTYKEIVDALAGRGIDLQPSRSVADIPTEHYQLGEYHSHWDYRNAQGSIVMRICRWEQPNGNKDIRPLIRTVDGWAWKHHPNPRPLFQLERLVNEADLPVILVEGEKTAVAAQKLFPQYIATTWAGGAQATGQADMGPLAGRDVILIPDCDAAGRKAMAWARTILEKTAKSVRTVDPALVFNDLPDKWDLADALREQRDVSGLLAESDIQADQPVFNFHTPSDEWAKNIPPRAFLYERHYMRSMVGVTAAAGGAGKSSIVLVELISCALGVDLFKGREPLRVGPLRVWYHNGEDPADEIRRRVAAICRHYSIDPAALTGQFMYTVGRDNPIIVAAEIDRTVIATPVIDEVISAITANAIDILAIDPFISTHRVPENSNDAMEVVMSQWRTIADKTNCAIEAVHHFRKSNGNEATADDIRGASAVIGAARSARIFSSMSKEDAATCGIDLDQRRRFVWEGQAKANMYVATDQKKWRELISVDLQNAAAPYDADNVGVASTWQMPDSIGVMGDEQFLHIMSSISRISDPLKRRRNLRSSGWVGKVIADAAGVDYDTQSVRSQINTQVESWIKSGCLRVTFTHDPKQSKSVECVEYVPRDY